MSNKITELTNKDGETYYKSVDDISGEIAYSFTEDFEDVWNQEDEDLYGESTTIVQRGMEQPSTAGAVLTLTHQDWLLARSVVATAEGRAE